MLRLNISSQKHGNLFRTFNTEVELEEYKTEVLASQHWGHLGFTEEIPAIVDENGAVIKEAETIVHPPTVSFETVDVTAETIKAQDINKYLKRIQFGQLLMAELAASNKAKLESGAYTSEQVLALKQDLAPIKDFVIEGSLGFALQTLQAAANVPADLKAYFAAKIQQYLDSEA